MVGRQLARNTAPLGSPSGTGLVDQECVGRVRQNARGRTHPRHEPPACTIGETASNGEG
jgi:hypothetical protein